LLDRGEVKPAPFHYHFDAYLNKFKTGPRRGNNTFLQRVKGNVAERMIRKQLGIGSADILPSATGR
jgi:hypothetical protein